LQKFLQSQARPAVGCDAAFPASGLAQPGGLRSAGQADLLEGSYFPEGEKYGHQDDLGACGRIGISPGQSSQDLFCNPFGENYHLSP